jgi:hypothetical protein
MTTFADLICRHGAASLDKQDALADLIGHLDWAVDLVAGTITFGTQYTFEIQLLGTESSDDETWLWAWANEADGLPEAIVQASRQVRAWGALESVRELTLGQFGLDLAEGHHLSMVASGLCRADAYYRAPYGAGSAFFLLTAPELQEEMPMSLVRMARLFNKFIGQFPCDHRTALRAYAAYKGFVCLDEGGNLLGTSAQGSSLCATFDAQGCMTEMSLNMKGKTLPSLPPKKNAPWWCFWR